MAAIYQADVWCDDCANLIREELAAKGKAPEDPDDETTFDSDEYPKRADDDESSDTPQHCASGEECINAVELPDGTKVGVLFGELTNDGIEYVKEAVADGGLVAELWKDHYESAGYEIA